MTNYLLVQTSGACMATRGNNSPNNLCDSYWTLSILFRTIIEASVFPLRKFRNRYMYNILSMQLFWSVCMYECVCARMCNVVM